MVCFGVRASGAVLAQCVCTQRPEPPAVFAGVSEDCCLDYHRCVRPHRLLLAQSYRRQEVSGSCNLPAVMCVGSQEAGAGRGAHSQLCSLLPP